jgi:hypothetical protein
LGARLRPRSVAQQHVRIADAMRMVRPPAVQAALLAPHLQQLRAFVLPTHLRACGVGGCSPARPSPIAALRALHAASHTVLRRTPLGVRATGEEKRDAPVLGRTALAGGGRSWRRNGESKRGYNYGGGLDDATTIVRYLWCMLPMAHGWVCVVYELLVVLGVCIAHVVCKGFVVVVHGCHIYIYIYTYIYIYIYIYI